jgi:hypothetical protein
MIEITNITDEPNQRHIIPLNDSEIIFDLRFYPPIQQWTFGLEWGDKTVKGVKLSTGVLHITNTNLPFDFIVTDSSNFGVDPFRIDDFQVGRCALYMLEPDEMEQFRGVPVEI